MKVAITCRDFSTFDRRGLQMLEAAGLEIADHSRCGYGSAAAEEEVGAAIGDAEFVLLGPEPCRRRALDMCPRLKMISRRGIGFDNIDLAECRRRGIAVARTLGAVEAAVAEHVMAYVLYFSRRIDLQNEVMQQHIWRRALMSGAKGRTLGLVGFGGIGREVAVRARAFGMNVLCYCRHPDPAWETQYGVRCRGLAALLGESDYVVIAVPLTEETRGMFDRSLLEKMKPGSRLINVARGGIVCDEDLREAVLCGHLAGAACDVYRNEPCTDSPLLGVPEIVLTPHTAPYTTENFGEMNVLAVQNLLDFMAGALKDRYRLV